jgi:murein L,D-transpeptidase YcbB/YkuD
MLLTLQSSQDPETLEGLVAAGSERWLQLDRPLPIYLLYFTAWAREDGTVRFHHDVYGRDEALGEPADDEDAPPGNRQPARGGGGP